MFFVSEFEALLPTIKYYWDDYNAFFTLKEKPCLRSVYLYSYNFMDIMSNILYFLNGLAKYFLAKP